MDIQSRILKAKLIEKIRFYPEYCRALGLRDRTVFRSALDNLPKTVSENIPEKSDPAQS